MRVDNTSRQKKTKTRIQRLDARILATVKKKRVP